MADYTEQEITLLAHQEHTHSEADTWVIGTEQDVRTWLAATLHVYHGNIQGTTHSPGVKYILQGRPNHSGANDNERWADLVTFQTSMNAMGVSAIAAAGEAIGQTILSVKADPTASLSSGSKIYLEDKGVVADGEWAVVDYAAAGPDIIVVRDGITKAMVEDDGIVSEAEMWKAQVLLAGVAYVRMLVNHSMSDPGSDIHFEAILRAATDIE